MGPKVSNELMGLGLKVILGPNNWVEQLIGARKYYSIWLVGHTAPGKVSKTQVRAMYPKQKLLVYVNRFWNMF